MEETMSIFDFLPTEEAEKYKPKKSTDWKWTMANDYPRKNGLTAFSCFACGGGSTMGYKLAGVDVLGCCEIDPKMNKTYVQNHHPKHNYCMDIRKFNNIPNEELPKELFDLDILDGSPPCTTFSMAGEREESWGARGAPPAPQSMAKAVMSIRMGVNRPTPVRAAPPISGMWPM